VVVEACRSGCDSLVETEVLFDGGDADFELEAFVDFVLLELGQLGVEVINFSRKLGLDAVDFCVKLVDALVQPGDAVFGRHVFDDMRQHISEFVEGCFLCCHTREVCHVIKGAHANSPDASRRGCCAPYARPGRHTIID
jgi:hypothetical protein